MTLPAALAAARQHKLSLASLQVMLYLAEHETCLMLDLSRALKTSRAAITGVMDRLEFLGLAKRENSRTDRRAIIASLTPQGCWVSQLLTETTAKTL
jgi:DNA-binding MarR family transcriptional regulator